MPRAMAKRKTTWDSCQSCCPLDPIRIKRYYKIVDKINGLEPQFEKMTEEELRAQTDKFRERYANGESLDDMLPEAFATVREASKRTMGMRHFDVQLIGAMALHEGHIAEMKTGEGKTLVSTLAGYLNAIAGKGVHVVTVNDYLAKRDSEWMGRIYNSGHDRRSAAERHAARA